MVNQYVNFKKYVTEIMCTFYDIPSDVLIRIALSLPTQDLPLFILDKFLCKILNEEELWRQKLEIEYDVYQKQNHELWKNRYIRCKFKWHLPNNNISTIIQKNILDKGLKILQLFVFNYMYILTDKQLYKLRNEELVRMKHPFENKIQYIFPINDVLFIIADNHLYKQTYAYMENIDFANNITMVSYGVLHCALIANNKLYTFGEGPEGQLGHGNLTKIFSPKMVPNLDNVTHVACSDSCTYVISNNKLYAFGANKSANLLLGDNVDKYTPQFVSIFNDVTSVHVFRPVKIIVADGNLYLYRYNKFVDSIPNIDNVSKMCARNIGMSNIRISIISHQKLFDIDLNYATNDVKYTINNEYVFVENIFVIYDDLVVYGIKN